MPTARKATSLTIELGCHRDHQAVLVLGGVGLAGAEQHRENRHRQRHHQRDVADDRDLGEGLVLAQDGFQRGRHRLELERDIGNRSDDGDQRHCRRDRLALAVARADEVGDRGDVLPLCELDHPAQQRRAQADHQDRADIDRQEVDAGACGETDRTEEGPGGAVDRKRQRVDEGAGAAALRRRQAVAIMGDKEQQPDVAEGGRDHAPVVQHRRLTPCAAPLGFAYAKSNALRCPGRQRFWPLNPGFIDVVKMQPGCAVRYVRTPTNGSPACRFRSCGLRG